MKIVVAGTRGIPHIQGGVETHCEHLYPRLVKLGCDVTVIRRSCYVTDTLSEYQGVKLKNVYAPRKKTFEAIIHSFLSVIEAKKIKPDILHIHAVGPSLVVPFARLLGLKVVVTHHGPDYDRQKWNKTAKFFLRLGERWGSKYSNELIVISNVINNLVKKKYKRNDAHLIFNGVESPVRASESKFIESLGLQKKQYIVAVSRFVQEKGLDLLVKAFSKLNKNGIKLVLAGDADHATDYSEKLKELAIQENVILTGFIRGNNLNELFTHAGLFVLPSFHEGLPIALLEAMSYNLDVLVSDIPANKEVGLKDTSYFESGNTDDLTKKLVSKLNTNFPSEVSYNMQQYNWNNIAEQVLKVYNKQKNSNHK